jgi:hypothetical protein
MKHKLEVIELAALRIACENELPKSTADNLNMLLRTLVPLLRSQQEEIERLQRYIAQELMNRSGAKA